MELTGKTTKEGTTAIGDYILKYVITAGAGGKIQSVNATINNADDRMFGHCCAMPDGNVNIGYIVNNGISVADKQAISNKFIEEADTLINTAE